VLSRCMLRIVILKLVIKESCVFEDLRPGFFDHAPSISEDTSRAGAYEVRWGCSDIDCGLTEDSDG
jgi:hypothetical protein